MIHPYDGPHTFHSITLPQYSKVFTPSGRLYMPESMGSGDVPQYASLPTYSLMCVPTYDPLLHHYNFKFYSILTNKVMVELSTSDRALDKFLEDIQRNYNLSIGQILSPHQHWSKWKFARERLAKESVAKFLTLMGSDINENTGRFGTINTGDWADSVRKTTIGDLQLKHTESGHLNAANPDNYGFFFYHATMSSLEPMLRSIRGSAMTVAVITKDGSRTIHQGEGRGVGSDEFINSVIDSTENPDTAYVAVSFAGYSNCRRCLSAVYTLGISLICFIPDGVGLNDCLPCPVPLGKQDNEYTVFHGNLDQLEDKLSDKYRNVAETDMPNWREQFRTIGLMTTYVLKDPSDYPTFGVNKIPAHQIHLVVDQVDGASTPKAWTEPYPTEGSES